MVLFAGGKTSGYMVLPGHQHEDPAMRAIRGSGKARAGFEGNVKEDKRGQNHPSLQAVGEL